MRHEFETVVTITIGAEDEHLARVTGWYTPATAAPFNGAPSDEEPEPARFEISNVSVKLRGLARDFLPFITDEQIARIEEEGLNSVACMPKTRPATAALSRAMGGGDDLLATIADICRPVRR